MNKVLFLLMVFSGFLVNAQIEEVRELRMINKKYDSLLIEYQNKAKDSLSNLSKKDRNKIMALHENEVNKQRRKIENSLLEKIKLKESEAENNPVVKQIVKCKNDAASFQMPNLNKKSDYHPTNSNDVKNETEFYGELKSTVTFIVNEDGKISNVRATGDNLMFNKELELTLYKIEKDWTPVCVNGVAQRNRFRLPVTMKFK